MEVDIKRRVRNNRNIEMVLVTFGKLSLAEYFADELEEKGYRIVDDYYKYDKPTVTIIKTMDIELVEFKYIIQNELEEFLKLI